MVLTNISVPSLSGGVSRRGATMRSPAEVEQADNLDLTLTRGATTRPAVEHRAVLDLPAGSHHYHWIDRADDERFLMVLSPGADPADLRVFSLDGEAQPVSYAADDPRPYLAAGEGDPRRRFRSLSVEDATFLLNRTVPTALTGDPLTYAGADGDLRQSTDGRNRPSWSEFDHPPTATGQYWYARDDDVGRPQGFYEAVSTDQPPWYLRVRTEPENSVLDAGTLPVRVDFDGEGFHVRKGDWTDRLSGDNMLNPGPSFIGNPLSDMVFHQGRFWFVSGEKLASSRTGDLFNLWTASVNVNSDSDPVDLLLPSDRTMNIEHMIPFQDALVMLSNSGRQLELRANGPITPATVMAFPTTSLPAVEYAAPAVMGSELYFAGERDQAHTLYAYLVQPQALSAQAEEVTRHVPGYIPAEISLIETHAPTGQLFLLTDAEPDGLYVYRTQFSGDERVLNSWSRWRLGEDAAILTAHVFGDYLYLVTERNGEVCLERLALGIPPRDSDAGQTLGYSVRLDRKLAVDGAYDPETDRTTWVHPVADATLDTVVLGAGFDTGDIRLAGTVFTADVAIEAGETHLSVPGDYAGSLAYIGRRYECRARLSPLYVRTENGQTVGGLCQLLTGTLRHHRSGPYRVEITPERRQTLVKPFVPSYVNASPLDGQLLAEEGRFGFRVMSRADRVQIDLVTDSPQPVSWLDMTFTADYQPSHTPVE